MEQRKNAVKQTSRAKKDVTSLKHIFLCVSMRRRYLYSRRNLLFWQKPSQDSRMNNFVEFECSTFYGKSTRSDKRRIAWKIIHHYDSINGIEKSTFCNVLAAFGGQSIQIILAMNYAWSVFVGSFPHARTKRRTTVPSECLRNKSLSRS